MFSDWNPSTLGSVGATIQISAHYDPRRMAEREAYWLKVIADDYADQYRQAGYVDGLAGLSFGFFGKKPKAPKIPWDEIYELARPVARQYAQQEEQNRIARENLAIEQTRYDEKLREARFERPTDVKEYTSTGVAILSTTGTPREQKIVSLVPKR